MRDSKFYKSLAERVADLGGYHNAHLHLDRAYTDTFSEPAQIHDGGRNPAHESLAKKHARISAIHASAFYSTENLSARLRHCLTSMITCGTRRADSLIDVTDDGLGLSAIQTARAISDDMKGQIDFRIGAYSPLGFRDDRPNAWALLEQAAMMADFIACLPERDDKAAYPDHIGYRENCERMVDLAHRRGTFLHVHTDQMNSAREHGTETLLEVLERQSPFPPSADEPRVWAVHVISPSAYDEGRWSELVSRLKSAQVGVICCPSGALGMRQLRREHAPTHNSIARVLDLSAAGIPVRLGSDNSADMLSPSTTTDLTDEVFLLSCALRFYNVDILAHLACGRPLTPAHLDVLRAHLEADYA